MTKRQAERYHYLLESTLRHGIGSVDLDTLLRCQRTLSRWGEEECNGTIQRSDETGLPYRYSSDGVHRYGAIPDREAGALKRAAVIAQAHGLTIYHQSDPRGCCLYLIRPGDVPEGSTVAAYYSNGIAVCID